MLEPSICERTRGPWATSLTWETKFKSINTFAQSFYTITLIWRGKKWSSPFGRLNGPYLLNLESPSSKDAFRQVWLELVKWFWRRFLNLENVFCNFVIISPWKRVWPFIWKKLNSFTQGCFLPSLVEIG